MYMHLRMYEHDAFNQRNTPKTRLNEILYIEKMLLLSLSYNFITWIDFPKERFPLQLIAYYVLYRINIAAVYTGVCENPLNGSLKFCFVEKS